MTIPPPTPFRPDRDKECTRVIQEAVYEIQREALEVGWTAAELAVAFARYAQGAQLRALPNSEYAAVAAGAVRKMTTPKTDRD